MTKAAEEEKGEQAPPGSAAGASAGPVTVSPAAADALPAIAEAKADAMPASAPPDQLLAAKPRVPRVESLTGLRWWAAFFVFTHHMTNLAPLPIAEFLKWGTSGVTFFFVLSGFVLTWSARPGTKIRTFYRRRFARIWPAHMVALLVAVFVFYRPDPDPSMPWIKPLAIGVLLLSVLLLHGWSNDPAIIWGGNPAAWTLSVEAFFYAYHPFVQRATARLRVAGGAIMCATVVVVGCVYYLSLYHYRDVVPVFPQPVLHSVAFLFGIGLAIMFRSQWRPRLPVWVAFAVFAVGLFTLYYTGEHPAQFPLSTTMGLTQRVWLTVLYGIVIVAVVSRDLRGGRSLLRSRPLVALGQWSYSFYLVHATLIYAIREFQGLQAPRSWDNLTWYAGLLVLSTFASWLLYKFVEHPLERRLRGTR